MGKKKINMTIRENRKNRQVTFYKRRKGWIKKVLELTKLCGNEIFLAVVNSKNQWTIAASSDPAKFVEKHWLNFKENVLRIFSPKDYPELLWKKKREWVDDDDGEDEGEGEGDDDDDIKKDVNDTVNHVLLKRTKGNNANVKKKSKVSRNNNNNNNNINIHNNNNRSSWFGLTNHNNSQSKTFRFWDTGHENNMFNNSNENINDEIKQLFDTVEAWSTPQNMSSINPGTRTGKQIWNQKNKLFKCTLMNRETTNNTRIGTVWTSRQSQSQSTTPKIGLLEYHEQNKNIPKYNCVNNNYTLNKTISNALPEYSPELGNTNFSILGGPSLRFMYNTSNPTNEEWNHTFNNNLIFLNNYLFRSLSCNNNPTDYSLFDNQAQHNYVSRAMNEPIKQGMNWVSDKGENI